MQDRHRTSINSASLTADEVARRDFPIVRKGFDPADVRVFLDSISEQLHTMAEREEEMRRRLTRAERRAARPEIDESTLTAALGQETSRVLRSAHDAAGDMRARAEQAAAEIIHQAHEDATRIRSDGERTAADRVSEAEVAAARIRSGAAAEADSVLQAARQEAQATLAGVQENCRTMVREAQEVRGRVLADLARRRRALYGQVEHLRGGRHNLVEAVRDAKRSFDHILETLERDFDPSSAAPPPSEDGPAEVEPLSSDAGAGATPQLHAVADRGRPAPFRGPPGRSPADRPTPARPAATRPVGAEERADSPRADGGSAEAATPPPPATELASASEPETPDRRRAGFRIIRRSRHPSREKPRSRGQPEDPPAPAAAPDPAEEEGIRILASAPDVTATTPLAPSADKEEADGGQPAVAGEAKEHARSAPSPRRRGGGGGRHLAPGSSAVDELFARVKAGRSGARAKTRQRATGPEQPPVPDSTEGGEEPTPAAGPFDERAATGAAAPSAPPPSAPPAPASEASAGEASAPVAEAEPSPPAAAAAAPATESAAPATEPGPAERGAPEEKAVEQAEEAKSHDDQPPGDEPRSQDEPQAQADERAGEEQTDETAAGPDDSYLRRRDDAVGPIIVALSRRLKRALQDDQNDLLDRLRSRGKQPVAEILPSPADHDEHYRRAGVELLARAERAGTSFLREGRAGRAGANGDGPGGKSSVALAGELASAVTDPLRRRLERSLEDAADSDDATVVEQVGAAYREWKAQRVERVAGDHVVAAFSCGELGVAREGTALRWIVDDGDERCPDCDDNALAGPLPRGERYPTGQAHPPAHSGCRCLLAPPPA